MSIVKVPHLDSKRKTHEIDYFSSDGSLRPIMTTTGSVTIGSNSFAVEGSTIRGLASERPSPVTTHEVIPYATYWSVDTGAVEVTTGTAWVAV